MKVLMAMSGGVDSSVAALLLTEAGHQCIGCTMQLYHNEDIGIPAARTCCALDDVEDAGRVARRLGMRYYVFNFSDAFREKVMEPFVTGYKQGLTPNPCLDCNRYMKFEKLRERALILGCDAVATGHYARISYQNGRYYLRKAADASKDQSYVLYHMTQEQLAHTLFPLGDMTKAEVRKRAAAAGFPNAEKPDSQDICFVPDGDYRRMIERYTGEKASPGFFVSRDGKILGQHRGIIGYTVGQHRGLGLSLPEKQYVCRICPEKNTVVLGQEKDLYREEALVSDFHWISGETPASPIFCQVQLRYRQKETWATAIPLPGGRVRLRFREAVRAVTPGQAAVLYDDDVVLGGGILTADEKGDGEG